MNELTLIFAGIAVVLGLHAWLWYTRRTVLAMLGLLLLFIGTYVFSAQLLGLPKPLSLTVEAQTRTVLWASIRPGDGIYVVLDGPRLHVMDWDYEQAKALQKMQGTLQPGDRITLTFGLLIPGEFHREPQPELPPKWTSP